jgi:hypothetical protein
VKRREAKTADVQDEDRPDPWFVVQVFLGALSLHFVFGTMPAILFFAGWLWCAKDLPENQD